jgi:hypothetical protein
MKSVLYEGTLTVSKYFNIVVPDICTVGIDFVTAHMKKVTSSPKLLVLSERDSVTRLEWP